MNFLSKNGKMIAFFGGLTAGAFRLWSMWAGPDEAGLYAAAHPGWIAYLVMSALAVVLFWFLSRSQGEREAVDKKWSMVGQALATVGMLVYGVPLLRGDTVSLMVGILAILSAAALLLGLIRRNRGNPEHVLTFILPCLFFMVGMFQVNFRYGGESEMIRFLPQFLAMAAAALAVYQLWGKAVAMEDHRKALFWQLTAGYLCLAAAPKAHLLYACVGIWLLISDDPMKIPERSSAVDSEETEPEE